MQTRPILRRCVWLAALAVAFVVTTFPARGALRQSSGQADKRIVILAGRPSHGPGFHEFRAGSMLLQKALTGFPGVKVEVYTMGWPTKVVDGKTVDDNAPLESADAILIYAD